MPRCYLQAVRRLGHLIKVVWRTTQAVSSQDYQSLYSALELRAFGQMSGYVSVYLALVGEGGIDQGQMRESLWQISEK